MNFWPGFRNVGKPLKTIGFIRFCKGSATWRVLDTSSRQKRPPAPPLSNLCHAGSTPGKSQKSFKIKKIPSRNRLLSRTVLGRKTGFFPVDVGKTIRIQWWMGGKIFFQLGDAKYVIFPRKTKNEKMGAAQRPPGWSPLYWNCSYDQ